MDHAKTVSGVTWTFFVFCNGKKKKKLCTFLQHFKNQQALYSRTVFWAVQENISSWSCVPLQLCVIDFSFNQVVSVRMEH